MEEQIFYVHNSKEFVVIPGIASANGVFASDNTKRIYIRKGHMCMPETFQIDQMTHCEKVTFLDCYFQPYGHFPKSYGEGPHCIRITKGFIKYMKENEMQILHLKKYLWNNFNAWIWLHNVILRRILRKIKRNFHL